MKLVSVILAFIAICLFALLSALRTADAPSPSPEIIAEEHSSSSIFSSAPISSVGTISSVASQFTSSIASSSSVMSVTQTKPKAYVPWGVYPGYTNESYTEFVQLAGATPDIFATFVHWGNNEEFPSHLAPSFRGKTLLIFWEAKDYNGPTVNQPDYSYDTILNGDHDAYIETFRDELIAYGGHVILVPFSEMNGDWSPWAGTFNGNTPQKHIDAYRYLRDKMHNATNVQFGWAVNHVSVPNTTGNSIASYYPGGEYVDIVGVDGFNFGEPWMSFTDIFRSTISRLHTYKKPIYIFSMASAEGSEKAAWITKTLTEDIPSSGVRAWVWFHEDKERNWRVDSDDASLNAFREAVQ